MTEILRRWQAGVPVRVMVDPKANPVIPGQRPRSSPEFAAAGIPMRQRTASAPGILHWKMMLFAGQNIVEFSGANFSPTAFVPQAPYDDYEDEAIYFSDDPSSRAELHDRVRQSLGRNAVLLATTRTSPNPPARVYPIYPEGPGAQFSAGGRLRGAHPEAVSEGDAGHRRDHVPHHGRAAHQRAHRRDAARDPRARPERHEGVPLPEPPVGLLQPGQAVGRRDSAARARAPRSQSPEARALLP